jgi:hypothetical protein
LPEGDVGVTRDGSHALLLNRLTSDGDIALFRKDGTTVGSIGTQAGRLVIGSGDTGLRMAADLNNIVPWNTTTNLLSDSAIDLGGVTQRFKDLYLSGGAYLGGTAAANKLDDYEEGSWTPSLNYGTVSAIDCIYTKIGNTVHVSGALADFSDYTTTEDVIISGLPFTSAGSSTAIGAVMYRDVSLSTIADLNAYVGSNSSNVRFYSSRNDGAAWAVLQYNNFDSGLGDLYFSITYRV